MIAYNLLESHPEYLKGYPNSNVPYEVNTYKDILYIETNDSQLPYQILQRSDVKESDIEFGHLYSHYKIDNIIYDSFLTNNYKAFASDQNKQLTIFDLL